MAQCVIPAPLTCLDLSGAAPIYYCRAWIRASRALLSSGSIRLASAQCATVTRMGERTSANRW